jgi:hypothetical protein
MEKVTFFPIKFCKRYLLILFLAKSGGNIRLMLNCGKMDGISLNTEKYLVPDQKRSEGGPRGHTFGYPYFSRNALFHERPFTAGSSTHCPGYHDRLAGYRGFLKSVKYLPLIQN